MMSLIAVWGMRVEKPSAWANVFQDNARKINGQAFPVIFARGYTIAIIQPMRQASTCDRVKAHGPIPSAPKQWKSDVHVKS